MASAHITTTSVFRAFLPRLFTSPVSITARSAPSSLQQFSHPLLTFLYVAVPSAIQLNLPGLWQGIWSGILQAVPKKKTSHMKKRHRQMAGKALEDVTALNKCSACGHVKRAHLLCPYCVSEIQDMFKGKKGTAAKQTTSETPTDV